MTPDSALTLRLAFAAVVALSGMTVAFMVYALALHLRSLRVERRREALAEIWRPRLLEAATGEFSSAPDQDGVVPEDSIVAPDDRVLFLELVTTYARALEGPERRNVERLGEPYLDALTPLLDDHDAYRRAYALDILGALGFEGARERFTAGLKDDSALVAMVAARTLARSGDATHVPLILERLDTFASWSANYLSSLLVSFGPEAAPPLRALATDRSADPRFRSVALQALRELNDMGGVDGAVVVLADETDPEVQAQIIRLAGMLGEPGHLKDIRAFASSPHAHVRAVALRAIASLSDGRTTDLDLVSHGLDDPSPWVALQAARGLVQLDRKGELEALAASASPRAALAAEVLETRG